MQKNVASQIWIVFAFDRTDGTPVTGDAANITANLRIDGGAANAVDDTNPAELEDGYYFFTITQTESNGDQILISPASSTGDVQVIGKPAVYDTTAPNFNALGIESDGDAHADVKQWLGTAVATPDTAGYPKTTIKSGTGTGEIQLTSGVADSNLTSWIGNSVSAQDTAGYPVVTVKDGTGAGEINTASGVVAADATAISGSSTAADNLETAALAYSATRGLSGTALPAAVADAAGGLPISDAGGLDMDNLATKDDVAGIANVGAASARPVDASPGGFVLTTGTNEQNNEDATRPPDGVEHQWDSTGGFMEGRYLFTVGGAFQPAGAGLTIEGRLNGTPADEVLIKANTGTIASPVWEDRGTIVRQATSVNAIRTFTLFTTDMMTGADAGKIQIQIVDNGGVTGATFSVDQMFVSVTSIADQTGYDGGAVWYDDTAGNTNTVPDVDGTARNAVSSWAAVKTLLTSTGLNEVHIANGSTVTLDANSDNLTLLGEGWVLNLGGQSIESMFVSGALVLGTGLVVTSPPVFNQCAAGAVTVGPSTWSESGIGAASGTFTGGGSAAGDYTFADCISLVPGAGVPSFDFSGRGAATGINNRRWDGGGSYTVDSDCTISVGVVAGGGQTFISSGANIELRGRCREATFTLSAGGTTPNIQAIVFTGNVTISGTSAAGTTILLDGIGLEPTDTSVNTTVTNRMINRTNWNGGDYPLDTDANGRMRVVDGTGAGEIDTTSGTVKLTDASVTTATFAAGAIDASAIGADAITNAKIADDAIAAENLATGAFTADAFAADALIAATFATNSLTADALATDAVDEIADGVADEVLTGVSHNVTNSLGRRIRELDEQVGYEGGSIWLDTVNGVAGTTVGENGTVNNPVDSIADAVTLAVATGRARIRVASGSTVPLVANLEGYEIHNSDWILQLEGFSISGTCVQGATVTGIGTGANRPKFSECQMGAVTLPPSILKHCGVGDSSGTFTAGSAGEYILESCYSVVPGSGTPAFVLTGTGGATGFNNRGWLGGSHYTVDSDVTISHEVLAGGAQTFISSGADIELRGLFRSATFTLSAGGTTPTIQMVGVTGPITLSGTSAAGTTVNLYGVSSSLTDTSVNTTVADETTSRINYIGGDYPLNTTALGNIGLDWGNVENPTTAVDLSATDIQLCDTTTTNTDMVGTDGANTTVPDAAGTAASLHATTDALVNGVPTTAEFEARTILAASYFDPTADTVANVTLVATTTTNTDMVGTDGANTTVPDVAGTAAALHATTDGLIGDVPTVAEFNARTILAAAYFDPAVDAVANVTLVATTTTNTDMVAEAPTVGEIDTELTSSHGVGSWQSGQTAITIAPIVSATVSSGQQNTSMLTSYQHSTNTPIIAVVNAVDDTPIDVSAVPLTFATWVKGDPTTIIFTLTTAEGEITVGGDDSNQVSVTLSTTETATAYQSLQWRLIGTSNDIQYATGYLDINAAPA